MSDRRTGDWRADTTKALYAFCRKMHVLPSAVLEEDPRLMNDFLLLFHEEMKEEMKLAERMKHGR